MTQSTYIQNIANGQKCTLQDFATKKGLFVCKYFFSKSVPLIRPYIGDYQEPTIDSSLKSRLTSVSQTRQRGVIGLKLLMYVSSYKLCKYILYTYLHTLTLLYLLTPHPIPQLQTHNYLHSLNDRSIIGHIHICLRKELTSMSYHQIPPVTDEEIQSLIAEYSLPNQPIATSNEFREAAEALNKLKRH